MTILCLARILAYFISMGDGDCEERFLTGQLDADGAQLAFVLQQGVVYWQAAIVRLTEYLEGLFEDHLVNHRDIWIGDRN